MRFSKESAMPGADVHQHLWGAPLLAALRARTAPPRLDGWTLHLAGEPPFEVDPDDHDVPLRAALARADGLDLALVSLSSPLGVELLPPDEARPLLDAYHAGAAGLPEPFRAWAAACVTEIDPGALARELDRGCAGLQLPANALLDAAGYRHCAPLLALLEERGLPLFVHPGPAAGGTGPCAATEGTDPAWWAAVVPYVSQMHAAWYAFRAFGRPAFPRLRVCFALLAGLAPLHGERLSARGGGRGEVVPDPSLLSGLTVDLA
ncbi:amidohydrolase, partial [Spirillospora sp. NPDC049652]